MSSAVRKLPLSRGLVALLDEGDWEWARQWKWRAHYGGGGYGPYVAREARVDGEYRTIRLHREIMQPSPGQEVDHVNGDTLDNRRANLRLASKAENARNRALRGDNSSGFKGVCWWRRGQRWRVELRRNGKRLYLGHFDDKVEAARAYDAAALEYFGAFARLNFPEKHDLARAPVGDVAS